MGRLCQVHRPKDVIAQAMRALPRAVLLIPVTASGSNSSAHMLAKDRWSGMRQLLLRGSGAQAAVWLC